MSTCFFLCSHIRTGFDALKHILRQFAPIIKSNITAPPSVGVDISREERYVELITLCYIRIRYDLVLSRVILSLTQMLIN